MRYFIELSFKGTNFHGWQIQENAHTVQGELNQALSTLLGHSIDSLGAGRTDTGVHATQFFAQFDTERSVSEKMIHQLNGIVDKDIRVKKIIAVKPEVNARFDAKSRTYQYWMHTEKSPFLKELSGFFPYSVDLNLLNQASEILKEYSDFKCFSKSNTQVKTSLCRIDFARWEKVEDETFGEKIIFTITADRFLRNMVRAIVGTMWSISKKELSLDALRILIENGKRSDAGVSVPACGLYLTNIEYDWDQILLK